MNRFDPKTINENSRALVVGLGKSGAAAAKLLLKHKARVTAIDSARDSALEQIANELEKLGARVILGAQSFVETDFDLVVLSPGVPTARGFISNLVNSGKIPVIGELELGYNFIMPARIVGITGTNGKTTTTELIEKIFLACGFKASACGNIGLPLCDIALEEKPYDFLSLEVSSFQLETIANFKPDVAILTNITPDHLDRYPTMQDYIAAKARIFENQSKSDWAVVQKEALRLLTESNIKIHSNLITYSATDVTADIYLKGKKIISRKRFLPREALDLNFVKLKGIHNAENLMATLAVSGIYRLPLKTVIDALQEYNPAPHRCELIDEIDGVQYINDSKATNVDAVAKAILSIDEHPDNTPNILLIAGGKDKGFAYDEIKPILKKRVKVAFLIGETAQKIFDCWRDVIECRISQLLENALVEAKKMAKPGDVVLLSPACSSFDQFRDYKHRGEEFRRLVKNLKNVNMLGINVNKNTT
ncbi:MAG: UDP-N-acetylmuramoyl-L-alanine--D-glutamate ligase [Verrucomicrobiia bacterium]